MSGNADKKLLVSKIVVQKKRADCRSSKLWHNFVVPAFFRQPSVLQLDCTNRGTNCKTMLCRGFSAYSRYCAAVGTTCTTFFKSYLYDLYAHERLYIYFFLAYVRVKKSCVVVPIKLEPREHARKGWHNFFSMLCHPFCESPANPEKLREMSGTTKLCQKVVPCKKTTVTHTLPTVYSESNSASSEARLLVVLPHPLQNALKAVLRHRKARRVDECLFGLKTS